MEPIEQTEELQILPWQQRVLLIPEEINILLAGGRGGGKSRCLIYLILRHCEQYGSKARVLILRETHRALEDLMSLCREVFGRIYGTGAKFNASEHFVKLPNGAYIEFGQLANHSDIPKYQGRSFTQLVVDEIGAYPDPALIDAMMANLRAKRGIPVRAIFSGNPGGPGMAWLTTRYVHRETPWKAFVEPDTGSQWVCCPSTFRDNTFIDQAGYEAQLKAACAHDPELLKAWLLGDWTAIRGAYFASVLSEQRNMIEPWEPGSIWPSRQGWEMYLAHDYGSSAPSVTFICAKSPGTTGPDGKFYPRGSILLLDELETSVPGRPSEGLGWTIPKTAEAIVEMCERWGIKAEGAADDACFSNHGHESGSIADEFKRYGVYFIPAKKADRLTGWQMMRTMLAAAGELDKPGLYISRLCSYFWMTVPTIPRDPKRPEDVDTRAIEHAADSCRYALLRHKNTVSTARAPW